MDSIVEIINTFTTDDIKSFRIFINRQKKILNRKDLDLFNLLLEQKHDKPKDIISKLYKVQNTEAYHALRKSLLRHIMDFIVLKQFDDDTSSLPAVTGIIGLARYLFENKKDILAWQYLKKAETLAQNNNYYDQLNVIYMLQIEQAQKQSTLILDEILKKYNENKLLADQNNRVAIALSIVRQKLNEMRLSGNVIDFEYIVNKTIVEYKIRDSFYGKPKLFFQFMSIFRSAVLAGKDYYSFEPFLLKNYNLFLQETGFKTKDNTYKAGLLYMIAHTLYRNKKFNESLGFLEQLKECIEQAGKALTTEYLSRLMLLSAANKFFLGINDEAISILEQALSAQRNFLSQTDVLNTQLNQCFYYLFSQNPSKANQTLLSILHSNKRCEKLMGKEWILKKDLVEVIVQYELKNFDIAQNRIKSIENSYKEFMNQARYERVKVFTNLISKIIIEPEKATTSKFFMEVEKSFTWLPVEKEDIHAVLFYAWLKSKLLDRTAYEVLLELTASNN